MGQLQKSYELLFAKVGVGRSNRLARSSIFEKKSENRHWRNPFIMGYARFIQDFSAAINSAFVIPPYLRKSAAASLNNPRILFLTLAFDREIA